MNYSRVNWKGQSLGNIGGITRSCDSVAVNVAYVTRKMIYGGNCCFEYLFMEGFCCFLCSTT